MQRPLLRRTVDQMTARSAANGAKQLQADAVELIHHPKEADQSIRRTPRSHPTRWQGPAPAPAGAQAPSYD